MIPSSGIIPTSDFGLVGFGLSRIRTWSDSDLVRFGLDWIRTSSDPDFEFTFTIDSLKPQVGFRLSWHPRKVGIRLGRNPTFDFFGPVSESIPTSDFRLRLSSRNRNPTRVRFRQVGIGFRPVGIKSEFGLVESEFGLVGSESVHPPPLCIRRHHQPGACPRVLAAAMPFCVDCGREVNAAGRDITTWVPHCDGPCRRRDAVPAAGVPAAGVPAAGRDRDRERECV